MDRSWIAGWVAAARGRSGRVHAFRVRAFERVHLAALLIALAPVALGQDVSFNPTVTQAEFEKFSQLVGQGIFPTPVHAARSSGVLRFDVGLAVTAVPIDDDASYWVKAGADDLTTSGYLAVPRIVVSKGLGIAAISGSYAKVPDSDVTVLGGALDIPLMRGGMAMPELALRGSYATLSGLDDFDARVMGLEVFLSKGFGPVTPYIAAGRTRTKTEGIVRLAPLPDRQLAFEGDSNRLTAGVRISLLAPKIGIEVTQGEETTYAAKVSFGF